MQRLVYTSDFMKKVVLTVSVVAAILPAQAQLFSPESLTGAAVGAVAGGVIGHNNGRHGGEGAAIGAGVGFLAGALVRESRDRNSYYDSPRVHVGGYYSSGHYGHHHHRPYYGGFYSHYSYRPSYRPYYYSVPTYVEQPVAAAPVVVQQPAPQPQPAPVTIINNHYYNSTPATPLAGANSLFGR